jgi:NCAIR mutase (PurE)-related protein
MMTDAKAVREILDRVARGETAIGHAVRELGGLQFEDLGFAKVDHHRELRRGCSEVIYCAGKTPHQVAEIARRLAGRSPRLLGTRATREHFEAAAEAVLGLRHDPTAGCIFLDREPSAPRRAGVVLVAAGTSDLPVAEEAALTLDLMGHAAHRIYDVGVAGLHRLLHHLPVLRSANVIIVAAGMEGALPSVVGGLVGCPVIAVPTSVGYGASFGGLAALLGMLNSCCPGIAVVNIDNGYGAGHYAATINAMAATPSVSSPPRPHVPADGNGRAFATGGGA